MNLSHRLFAALALLATYFLYVSAILDAPTYAYEGRRSNSTAELEAKSAETTACSSGFTSCEYFGCIKGTECPAICSERQTPGSCIFSANGKGCRWASETCVRDIQCPISNAGECPEGCQGCGPFQCIVEELQCPAPCESRSQDTCVDGSMVNGIGCVWNNGGCVLWDAVNVAPLADDQVVAREYQSAGVDGGESDAVSDEAQTETTDGKGNENKEEEKESEEDEDVDEVCDDNGDGEDEDGEEVCGDSEESNGDEDDDGDEVCDDQDDEDEDEVCDDGEEDDEGEDKDEDDDEVCDDDNEDDDEDEDDDCEDNDEDNDSDKDDDDDDGSEDGDDDDEECDDDDEDEDDENDDDDDDEDCDDDEDDSDEGEDDDNKGSGNDGQHSIPTYGGFDPKPSKSSGSSKASPTSPPSTNQTMDDESGSKGIGTGPLVGIVLLVLGIIGLVSWGGLYFATRRRAEISSPSNAQARALPAYVPSHGSDVSTLNLSYSGPPSGNRAQAPNIQPRRDTHMSNLMN